MHLFVHTRAHSIVVDKLCKLSRLLKLEVLSLLANSNNYERILKELQSYVRHHNTTFVCAAIRTVGRVGDAAPTCAGATSMFSICTNRLIFPFFRRLHGRNTALDILHTKR